MSRGEPRLGRHSELRTRGREGHAKVVASGSCASRHTGLVEAGFNPRPDPTGSLARINILIIHRQIDARADSLREVVFFSKTQLSEIRNDFEIGVQAAG